MSARSCRTSGLSRRAAAACVGWLLLALPWGAARAQWQQVFVVRSTRDTTRRMIVRQLPNSLELMCIGQFYASATIVDARCVGVVKSPDTPPNDRRPVRLQIVRLTHPQRNLLRTCFSSQLEDGDADCEEWSVPVGLDSLMQVPYDTSLPGIDDFVYVEELPEPIEKVLPGYPTSARRDGIQGTVLVKALVGEDGSVKAMHIDHSIPALDDYAIGAVGRWKFTPARTKGKPVAI